MTRSIETVDPATPVLEAVRRMNSSADRPMVVKEGDELRGVVTREDLRRGVIAAESPAESTVEEIMSTRVARCGEDTPLEKMRQLIKRDGVDHLLILDQQQRLVGLVPASYALH
jgi:CBS domain-containing protein